MEDAEVQAIQIINEALSSLDDDQARVRVLQWAAGRYGATIDLQDAGGAAGSTQDGDSSERSADNEPRVAAAPANAEYREFHEFFDAADPANNKDRALVAAYWLQEVSGEKQFTGNAVNRELKQLGHGLNNVTHTLTSLMRENPALVRQKGKSGKSKQSWKTYFLTEAGKKHVKQMFQG